MGRIAVIGSGIAGMSAAYLLSRKHEVTLFEREPRLGGHTHTHIIETSRGPQPIDTGFIVHNDRTYPNLIRLFAELGVVRQKSDMSFGVSDMTSGMEYSSRGLSGFFATRSNILRPAHYRLFREMVRFNKVSNALLQQPHLPEITLGEYMRQFHPDLGRLYLYPMAAAVWSTSLEQMEEFPAVTLLQFFLNHGFLTINGHPQWYTVKGGSSTYIAPLTAPYRDRIVTNAKVHTVCAKHNMPTIHLEDASEQQFDEVVFACHGPQALGLISEPTDDELSVLFPFRTNRNPTTLHTDEGLLPRSAAARASWNYHLDRRATAPTLTYDMNRLQSLDTPERYCVTLNDAGQIDSRKTLRELVYFHPLFTMDAIRAQQRWNEISNVRHLHFCGAYWSYGFHEDGLNSAIRVARSLGVNW